MKLFAVAIYISFGVLIPYVDATCDDCKTTWDAVTTKTCTDDDTYIKCLLAAADSDAGCDTRYTKMAEAKDHRDAITGPACDALTDTCICQVTYARVDVAVDATKCTKLKEQMNCLMSANDLACDGTTKKSAVANTHDGLIVDAVDNCRTGLTETCKCQIDYAKVDVTAAADKCTGAKDAIKCLVAATDAGCDAATARKDTVAAINTIVTNTASCDLTDTCNCETAYAMADVTAAADKCTKLKEEMHCLMSANGMGCDGTSARSAVANTLDGLIVDTVANCRTDLTDTCKCQISYTKATVADDAAKCTQLKDTMHCLVKADGMGCDGTAKRSAVATTLDALIVDANSVNCKTDLTATCKCAITYALTDTTDKTNKCSAANTATTCLEAISSTTDTACDGSTQKATYMSGTITPIVTEACSSGTAVLLSVWVAAACVLLSGMIQQ